MNITIDTKRSTASYQLQNQQNSRDNQAFVKGSIIQGIVGKVSDQISVHFNEKKVDVSKEMLPHAKEGDKVNFKVIEADRNSVRLQVLEQNEQITAQLGAGSRTEVMSEGLEVVKDGTGTKEKEEAAAQDTTTADDLQNKMTEEDYQDLSKEGISLEKYELERFDRALERIKDSRAQQDTQREEKIEEVKNYQETIEKLSLSMVLDGPLKNQIASMLDHAGLPVTKANVQAAANSLVIASQGTALSDASINYLLKNQMNPTAMNLYKANYSNAGEMSSQESSTLSKQTSTSEEDWMQLNGQVKQAVEAMQQAGIPATMEDARWLYDHELPINQQSMQGYQQLVQLRDHFNLGEALQGIVNGMAKGQNALDAELITPESALQAQVLTAIQGFSNVSEEAVNKVVAEGQKINLKNLLNAEGQLSSESVSTGEEISGAAVMSNQDTAKSGGSDYSNGSGAFSGSQEQKNPVTGQYVAGSEDAQKELALITARRQLEEIRVKLTYDAGIRLMDKGIDISTQGIDTLVTELRGLEDVYYEKLLAEGGVSITPDNITLAKGTLNQVEMLRQAPCGILGTTLASQDQVTLQTLANEGENLQAKLKEAGSAYEPLMTAPRADLGDSIKKAFRNVDDLLEETGLQATEANRRAVRILGYNQMEITKESVEQMKDYDMKVNRLVEALKPSMVVELIKNKINPLDTPISEVSDFCEQIQEQRGSSDEEKYSNYLAKIQKSNTLTPEERDTYIGVYRLLNNVEKTDGKAIGYLVKSDREITLNNLLSAVRTVKGSGIDASIDDSFGAVSNLTYQAASISSQLEGTFDAASEFEQAKMSYQEQLNHEVLHHMEPGCFGDLADSQEFGDSSLEQLYEKMQTMPKDNAGEYENVMQQLEMVSQNTEAVKFLKDYGQETSIEKAKAAKDIRENADVLYRNMADAIEEPELFQSMEQKFMNAGTYEEAVSNYQGSLEQLETGLKAVYGNPATTVEEMMQLNGYLKDTSLLKTLSEKEYCQIPIEINGKLVGVSVSFQSDQSRKGKVSIALDTEEYGQVKADLQFSGKELSGFILYENQSGESAMNRTVEEFKTQLSHQGIEIRQISQGCDETYFNHYHYEQSSEQTKETMTTDLFDAAKTFIACMKR